MALVALCSAAGSQPAAGRPLLPDPTGTAGGSTVQMRAALAQALLSASEASKRLEPGRIVPKTFPHGIDALVVTRDAALSDLGRRFPTIVREPRPGVWVVRRTIFVARGATLFVESPEVRELRLISMPGRYASIIARTGNLEFHGRPGSRLVVHSWNPKLHHPDRMLRDGRATVAVREQGRLDASYATFARLGFYRGTVSGFALWAHAPSFGTGTVTDSRFVNNYNGAFSYGARDMRWIHNRFEHNIVYGLDPHTGSSDFLVERNYAARNGRHGIIFSRDCFRNVIRNNLSEHNRWHGIVIDDGKYGNGPSDYNVVVDNLVRENAKVGIQIDGSAHNLIRGNRIIGSRQGIRVLGPADQNIIAGNSVGGARDFGVILHAPSRRTFVTGNTIFGTPTGVRIHGSTDVMVKDNRIVRVLSHAVKVDDADRAHAREILLTGNEMTGSGTSPVRISTGEGHAVGQRANRVSWNYPLLHDVAYALRTDVGPGLWLLLLVTAIVGPLLFALARVPRKGRIRA